MTSFIPAGRRVLVAPIYSCERRIGRILVPEAHQEQRPQEATVVAVGHAAKLDAQVGDRVITDAHAGTWVEVGGKRHRLLEPQDILAVVEQV